MQNTTQTQTETQYEEIRVGEYQFYITGVFREDKNGYQLKTSKGNIYESLKIIVLTNGQSRSISHPIYGLENIKSIVYAINNPALTFVFESKQSKGEKFELEILIGESGILLLGHRSYNGKNYPKIECFLKEKIFLTPKPADPIVYPVARNEFVNCFKQELEETDNVLF